MHIENPEYVLDLPSSWVAIPGDDPEQASFESQPLSSSLTVSIMPAGIPREKIEEVAHEFLKIRQQSEVVDPTHTVTFGDGWVSHKPEDELAEIAYAGFDNRGRIFRFMGFVTTRKVVSFYCATTTTDNELSKRVFDEAFRGFKFYVP